MSAIPLCSRVSDGLQCPACKKSCIVKNGSTKTGKQQYYCKICTRRFIAFYTYNAYLPTVDNSIVILTKEGLGIRSIARYLGISCTTVLKRLLKIAERLTAPITFSNGTYEVDELHTYIGNKSQAAWIVYALERTTGNVVAFNMGNRSSSTIATVIDRLGLLSAQCIYTDKLPHYRSIISKRIHKVTPYGTNHIERKNLTLRTHLKRLSRRTICFSKSVVMLTACLKIYFWG